MYARYACAVYGVQKYEDEPRPEDRTNDRPKKRGRGSCGCGSDPLTEASIRQEVAKVAGIAENDILYMSPSNQVLAHLPYMIALGPVRRTGRHLLNALHPPLVIN